MKDGLTTKQRRFVEAYAGNATEAAIAAGYSKKTARVIGMENLTKPAIAEAIRKQEEKLESLRIADREERQEFFTAIMRNADEKTSDRLKAGEILSRIGGDFLDRVDHTNSDGNLKPQNVMIVPMAESIEEWEKLAVRTQAKLKADVKQ